MKQMANEAASKEKRGSGVLVEVALIATIIAVGIIIAILLA